MFDKRKAFTVGGWKVATRLATAHSHGGATLVVVGGMVLYADALRTNRDKILTLPDQTILCPGHGPMTTVGEEKRHNPFFPG